MNVCIIFSYRIIHCIRDQFVCGGSLTSGQLCKGSFQTDLETRVCNNLGYLKVGGVPSLDMMCKASLYNTIWMHNLQMVKSVGKINADLTSLSIKVDQFRLYVNFVVFVILSQKT